MRLKFIVARDEVWQSFSQGMILCTYGGPAVLGRSLTKLTFVVLRLPSGVLKNTGRFMKFKTQFVVMLPASCNIGVCMGAPIN